MLAGRVAATNPSARPRAGPQAAALLMQNGYFFAAIKVTAASESLDQIMFRTFIQA
jgi:hypothetical protein